MVYIIWENIINRKGVSEQSRSESIEMVWAYGKNGCEPYGQKGVDGRRLWRTGTREAEAGLDGWCEGGLWQQRTDGGGFATMRERSERVESPGSFTRPFLLVTVFFRTALPCSGGYHLERGGMPLHGHYMGCHYMGCHYMGCHYMASLLKIKAQASSIWAKGCILMIVCVCYLT